MRSALGVLSYQTVSKSLLTAFYEMMGSDTILKAGSVYIFQFFSNKAQEGHRTEIEMGLFTYIMSDNLTGGSRVTPLKNTYIIEQIGVCLRNVKADSQGIIDIICILQ